jgi:hypothetical protein
MTFGRKFDLGGRPLYQDEPKGAADAGVPVGRRRTNREKSSKVEVTDEVIPFRTGTYDDCNLAHAWADCEIHADLQASEMTYGFYARG